MKRLETMEGKALAIDSSIWIYQFQATMRDREGKALVNAHVLGFLRRICKLLFYGIKPVFVFDGGAPALKRNTIVRPEESESAHAKSALSFLLDRAQKEEERRGSQSCQGCREAPCCPHEARSSQPCTSAKVGCAFSCAPDYLTFTNTLLTGRRKGRERNPLVQF